MMAFLHALLGILALLLLAIGIYFEGIDHRAKRDAERVKRKIKSLVDK